MPSSNPSNTSEVRRAWRPTAPELVLPPERLLRRLALALPAVIAAVLCSYFLFDQDVAAWVHAAPRSLRRTASHVTELGNATPIVAIALVLGLIAAIARKWALVSNALLLLLALAATGGINTTLKFILGRARPSNHVDGEVWTGTGRDGFYFFETGYKLMGFPSGHSATAGALAAVGLLLRPRFWPLWLAFAVVIPASRVMTNSHYVADTIAGVWVGATCATLVAIAWIRLTEWRAGHPLELPRD